MMYSFAQRSDCEVLDEPFYGAYLAETGAEHPLREETLCAQSSDRSEIAKTLSNPPKTAHRYEKHMTHHMLPGWDMSWLADVVNVFLIRHPARVIASYAAKREDPTLDDIGFRQQFEIFEQVRALGQTPLVVDSFDIRRDPEAALSRLCEAIGIPFKPAMLSWAAGPKAYDGAWAPHWYDAVHRSTGFAAAEGALPMLDAKGEALLSEALPYYEAIRALAA
jgi:hypothetical protein